MYLMVDNDRHWEIENQQKVLHVMRKEIFSYVVSLFLRCVSS